MFGLSVELNASCFQSITPYEVTSWEKWDADNPQPNNAKGRDIIVKSGVRLTIEGITVEMAQEHKIIVEANGSLIIDGSTITDCDNSWGGIIVEGLAGLPQVLFSSAVILKNGSLIEKSIDGVTVKAGAYLDAENSTFLNNMRDVTFEPYESEILYYPSVVPSGHYKNYSKFRKVDFLTDDNLQLASPKEHISMYRVIGIRFSGCKFEDLRNLPLNFKRRNGISSLKSSILIDKLIENGDEIPTEFKNLYYGIKIYDNSIDRTSVIENSVFNLNRRGIFVNNNDNIRIENNTFIINDGEFRKKSLHEFYWADYGAYIDHSQDFTIQNNTFQGEWGSGHYMGNYGLVIRESKSSSEVFNKNEFIDLRIGAEALGSNIVPNHLGGLTFECNRFEDNQHDFVVQEDEFYATSQRDIFAQPMPPQSIGVKTFQGSHYEFPSNEFTDNVVYNIYNGYQLEGGIGEISFRRMFYFVGTNEVGTVYEPEVVNESVTVIHGLVEAQEDCEPIGTEMVLPTLNNLLPIIENQKAVWVSSIDDDRTQQLLTDIITADPATAVSVYNDLLSISPWLSEEVLATLAAHNEHFTDEQVRDVMVANPTAGRSMWVQTELENAAFPIDTSYINEIQNAASNFVQRDSFEAAFGQQIKEYNKALRAGIFEYRNDTVHSVLDLDHHLRHPTDKSYHYKLVDFYVEAYHFDSAYSVMSSIENVFNLTSWEEDAHNSKMDFISKLEEWEQEENMGIYDTNSDRKVWLLNYINNQTRPVMDAYNLLTIYGIDSLPDDHVYLPGDGADTSEETDIISHLDELIQEDGEFNIKTYPNPATDQVRLELKGEVADEQNVFVQLMNLKGQKVAIRRWHNLNEVLEFNTTSFPEGVYVVQVSTEKEVLGLTKIIIKK